VLLGGDVVAGGGRGPAYPIIHTSRRARRVRRFLAEQATAGQSQAAGQQTAAGNRTHGLVLSSRTRGKRMDHDDGSVRAGSKKGIPAQERQRRRWWNKGTTNC